MPVELHRLRVDVERCDSHFCGMLISIAIGQALIVLQHVEAHIDKTIGVEVHALSVDKKVCFIGFAMRDFVNL